MVSSWGAARPQSKRSKLHAELKALPFSIARTPPPLPNRVAVLLVLVDPGTGKTLSFLSTTTVFGIATDVTLAELTLECFYPADNATRAELSRAV